MCDNYHTGVVVTSVTIQATVVVPLEYTAAESLHKCAVQWVRFAGHANGDAAHEVPDIESHCHALPPVEECDQPRRPVLRAAVSVDVQHEGMWLSRPTVAIDESPRERLQSSGALGLGEHSNEHLPSLVANVRCSCRHVGLKEESGLSILVADLDAGHMHVFSFIVHFHGPKQCFHPPQT